MPRHVSVLFVTLFHCLTVHAQWSSFKPVTLDVLPKDQREIDQQTVEDGKVVPKEVRVDWYGFTLRGGTNIVEDRYQYPVADPTLAPGDKIILVRTTEVTDADSVNAALRATPATGAIPISVLRQIQDAEEEIKVTLYRGDSSILRELLAKKIAARPPFPESGKRGTWGEVRLLEVTLRAIDDNGQGIFDATFSIPRDDRLRKSSKGPGTVRAENVLLRGWNLAGLSVGDRVTVPPIGYNKGQKITAEVIDMALQTGSSGIPNKRVLGGGGFLCGNYERGGSATSLE